MLSNVIIKKLLEGKRGTDLTQTTEERGLKSFSETVGWKGTSGKGLLAH